MGAETGRWVYSVKIEEDLDSLSVKVESKSRDENTDPVMTRCWISTGSQSIDTNTDVKLAVVAEVTQGSKAVIGAKIQAEIERPMDSNNKTQPPVILDLMDNGAGADKIKNDGIYSRYFAKYTGRGRYSVKCQVSGDQDTGVNGGFLGSRVFPAVPDPQTPLCCGGDARLPGSVVTPTGNFTRHAAGGAFQVSNPVDPGSDTIPPARVTDLKVTNLPDKVRLEFTAPGDDLDSKDAAAEYVFKVSSTVRNLTENFEDNKWNRRITETDLVSTDLAPVTGGAAKTIDVNLSVFHTDQKSVIAMKAIDEAGNQSPVSNPVQIYIPDSAPTSPTTPSPTSASPNSPTTPSPTSASPNSPTTPSPSSASPLTISLLCLFLAIIAI